MANLSSKSPHFDDLSDEVNRLVSEGKLTDLHRTGAIYAGLKRYVVASKEICLPAAATADRMAAFVSEQGLRTHAGVIYAPILDHVEEIRQISQIGTGRINLAAPQSKLSLASEISQKTGMLFNVGAKEDQLWATTGARLYEDRVHSHRVNHGHGATVRVARGLYFHAGSGRSRVVSRETHDHVDTGNVLVTSKAIYFAGRSKSFKIPFSQIVGINPCHGGAEILRGRGKSEYLVTGDEWFLCNLLSKAMQS